MGTNKRDPGCIFCKIIDKQIPGNVVAETEHMVALRDINPQAPTHILLVPKDHIPSIAEAENPEALGKLFMEAGSLARREKLDNGFRLVVNTGDDGGQTVHHLHIHLLGGRSMTWPPG